MPDVLSGACLFEKEKMMSLDISSLEDITDIAKSLNGYGGCEPTNGEVSLGDGRVEVLDTMGGLIGHFTRTADDAWRFEPL